MYTELATIMSHNGPSGFLMDDGKKTVLMDMEETKNQAAAGNVDTLFYDGERFVPVLNESPLKTELKKNHVLRKYEKSIKNMTFDGFVECDCQFHAADVSLMEDTPGMILGDVCLAFCVGSGRLRAWYLTVAFYTVYKDAENKLLELLSEYEPYIPSIKNLRARDGFILVNLPLADPKSGFDLCGLQNRDGLRFRYNDPHVISMDGRVKDMKHMAPFPTNLLMRFMIPSGMALLWLARQLKRTNQNAAFPASSRNKNDNFEKEE